MGIICPRQESHRRVYFARELRMIRIVVMLRKSGWSFQTVRRVLPRIEKSGARYLVIFTARIVRECQDEAAVIEVMKNADRPATLIDLADAEGR